MSEQPSLRILIADDSDSDRLILKAMLGRLGHQVLEARSGLQAVKLFQEHEPELVLLDVMMPEMDGMEAARRIKALAGETLVPVIFLTSLSDAGDLARCLESGDDFLSKPYDRVIIQAKINAFDRMRRMHATLSEQRDLIHEHNRKLLQEQQVAKRVFDNVAHTGCLDAPNIRFYASPLSIFNGDVLFASPRPAGGFQILIGDFTGHGLPAAIGAMPVAEIFYGMTGKGFGCEDVLSEINQKLKRILPTGMFCCAAMIQVDFHTNQLRVWNGGLPDGFLIRRNGERLAIPSAHLPLGVLEPDRFSASVEWIQTEPGDVLLMMTDGVLEADNSRGSMFGEERLRQSLDRSHGELHPFEAVMAGVTSFVGGLPERDDLTIFTLDMVGGDELDDLPNRLPQSALRGPANWQCVYEVCDGTLAHFNPLPLLLHICMEVPGLRRRSGEIYTLLAELYANALEHGILELQSDWKNSSEGFGRYYAEKERRLKNVSGHWIRFTMKHQKARGGGELRIVCEDSGSGFDYQRFLGDDERRPRYAGRGLSLLQQLSDSLCFSNGGTRAEIVYHWRFADVRDEQLGG